MESSLVRPIRPHLAWALFLSASLIGSLFVPQSVVAIGPSVIVSLAAGQPEQTNRAPINFTVVFSDPVEGFTGYDVSFVVGGAAGGPMIATVTGGPKAYNLAVTGMTTSGTVRPSVPAGVARNPADEPNLASTWNGDVRWWAGPFVSVHPAAGQADPTNTSPINFTAMFTDPVEGFVGGDVRIQGSAGGTKTATVTGGPKTYNIAVTGMTTAGTVNAWVPIGVAFNPAGDVNFESNSTPGNDDTISWSPGPSITINQAAGQADPTGNSPITFTVVFSAAVTGFTGSDVVVGGTAGGTNTTTVTGSGTTYSVAVTGMTTSGTVIATVPGEVAVDAGSLPNLPSTSTDNTVTWSPVAAAITLTTSAPIPPGAHDPVILWGGGFTLGVQFGTTGANKPVQLQGTRDGAAWTTITTLTTDASGRASFNYRPVTNLYYRAVVAGAPDLAAATSNQVRTVVRELAVMRPTNNGATKSISRNASIEFTTTVRPSRPELAPPTVTFFFYHQVSGVWQLSTTRAVNVDSAGQARTTFIFGSSGQWSVRSQANPTPYNANSVPTPAERYSVG